MYKVLSHTLPESISKKQRRKVKPRAELTQFYTACKPRSDIIKPMAFDSKSQDFSRAGSLGKSVSLMKEDGSSHKNG